MLPYVRTLPLGNVPFLGLNNSPGKAYQDRITLARSFRVSRKETCKAHQDRKPPGLMPLWVSENSAPRTACRPCSKATTGQTAGRALLVDR